MNDHEQLIDDLRALRNTTEPTSSPDFTVQVLSRTSQLAPPSALRQRKRWRRLGVGSLAVILAVVPGPRMALARWFGIGSVRIERDQTTFQGIPKPILELDLGDRSNVADASRQLGHRMFLTTDRQPAGVWVQKPDPSRPGVVTVNSVYIRGKGAALVSEIPGPGDVAIAGKTVGPGTRTEYLTIKNRTAVWISDAPHQVGYLDATGNIVYAPVRLAGNVLLWADDTRTIRIEGLRDRAAAITLLEKLG